MNVDLREFRSAFVAEAEEHLATVQRLLLEMERNIRDGKRSPRELRELMRLLHTIKGLSAMVGVEPIVTVAHKMESVLRAAERAGGLLDEPTIEIVLRGARSIEARVRAVAEDRPIPPPAADLLLALDSVEPPVPASLDALPLDTAISAKLSASERHQLRSGAREGRRAIRVDFAPSSIKADAGLSITTVRQRLAPIAEIVKIVPLGGGGGLVFALLLLSTASSEAIADAVGVTPNDVEILIGTSASPSGGEIPESDPAAFLPPAPDSSREDDLLISASASGSGSGPDRGRSRGVLRVDAGRVDDAIDMLGDLVVTRSRLAHAVDRLAASGTDTRELRSIMADNARQLRELRAAILRVRMVPMTVVLERLPLVVRGLGRASSKAVRIDLDVGAAELDKTVAERLFPALVHIVRNAVDHGIEPPEERTRSGKSPTATIRVASTTHDRFVEVTISDDGRGVDRAKVAARAGLSHSPPKNDSELLDLICRAGLSTRTEVDTVSGRGLGMDIVRKTVVHGLGGSLAISSTEGRGTTFVLSVPLTVAVVDAFIVRCEGERFAIPVSIVEEIVDLSAERIVRHASGGGVGSSKSADAREKAKARLLARRGETVPLFDLAPSLDVKADGGSSEKEEDGDDQDEAERTQHALVVRRGQGGALVAYAVDRILGQQEIVVRPLVDPLVAAAAVSGTTDLGDGLATIVLDLIALSFAMEARIAA
jgi:two-component system, chemotaxis family, sensor kinase CheA